MVEKLELVGRRKSPLEPLEEGAREGLQLMVLDLKDMARVVVHI